jgi:hypothetical protein
MNSAQVAQLVANYEKIIETLGPAKWRAGKIWDDLGCSHEVVEDSDGNSITYHMSDEAICCVALMKNLLQETTDTLRSLQDENAKLRGTLEFMRNYTGFEARACAFCVYAEGKFVRYCRLHEEQQRLHLMCGVLTKAATHVPPGFYLKLGVERHEEWEDGEPKTSLALHACLYEETPEEGWSEVRHPADKFLDRIRWSVSALDVESFERLTANAIVKHWPEPQKVWTIAAKQVAYDEV